MDAVTAGLLGGALVALIQGGFSYFDKRKTAPELVQQKLSEIEASSNANNQAKLLDFWIKKNEELERKQTEELNGIRKSFESEKNSLSVRYNEEISQLRREVQAEKTTNELVISSLNNELRRMIEQRGQDQLEFQKQITLLKDEFNSRMIELEKEKTVFLNDTLKRLEDILKNNQLYMQNYSG